MSLFDLSGKTALVTGSSQGIGFALARGLGEAGAALVLNGRDAAKLKAAAQTLKDEGLNVRTLAFDAIDHAAVKAAVDGFEAETGAIDILVNNAGMQFRTTLEDYPSEMFTKLLETNISTVFNVGQACAKHMIARRADKIINIASVQTSLARPGIAPCTATKGELVNQTQWRRHVVFQSI